MLREYKADLHIHTCLSPCASLDLSPRKIVDKARQEGLDIIAITDHNTARNVPAVMHLGESLGLQVIPGLEVQSREEIHLLTLFPQWGAASAWQEELGRYLPEVKNDPDLFGDQPVVDEEGNILEFEERLLLNSIALSLEEIKSRVEGYGGTTIPSHFDKGSFSLISQLGFIPPDLELEALEMSRQNPMPIPTPLPRIVSSDAHHLEEIGSAYTVFLLADPSLAELRRAWCGQGGRRIVRRIDGGSIVL